MLRTTVSRVKKVCSGVLVPRILRGDQCCGPVSYAVVRKSFESTKSTDDDKQGTLASEDNVEKKSDEAANPGAKTINQSKAIVSSSLPLTHRERCQRIIDKAFGPCEHTEAEFTEQYFSHTVNLEDTRREILESEKAKLKLQEQIHIKNPLLPESRTPYGIFKINRELIEEDHDENTLKDSVLKVHPAALGYLEDTRREILESEKAKLKLQEEIHIKDKDPLLPESGTPYGIFKINRELIEEDHDENTLKDSVLKVHPAALGYLEDTRREILESEKAKLKLQEEIHIKDKDPLLPESGTPYGIFKINRELIEEDHDENTLKDSVLKVHPAAEGPLPLLADKEDPVKPVNIPKATAEEPDLTKNLENIGTAEETVPIIEPYLTNAKEDFGKFVNNPESIENKAFREDDAETIEMVKDERKTNLYQKAIPLDQIHTLLPYTRTQIGVYTLYRDDENQDEIVFTDSSLKTLPDVEDSQFADRENLLPNAKEVKKCVNDLESKALHDDDSVSDKMVKDERKHMFINATTAKEDEEQLTQKLETIEETPLVEAQIPKLEGFNVTPRVLGDQSVLNSNTIEKNQDNSPRVDLPGNLDDVAKRCLNSPIGQIDEMLLNEIEKRPTTSKSETKNPPLSSSSLSKPLLGDILVQMDEIKKQPNVLIEEKILHCESSKFEVTEKDGSKESYVTGLISPIPHITLESRLPDLNEEAEENNLTKSKEDSQPVGETVQAIKHEIEDTSPLKNTKIKEAIVTEIHILGIDKIQDPERTSSIVTTKAPLSEELKSTCLSKDAQCNAETNDTYTKITSFNSPNDASNKIIKNDRLLNKSEYISNFKGVRKPTYYGTVNASKYAMNESQSKDDKKMFSSRSLSAAYMWGHKQQDASASKIKKSSLPQEETDKIEKYYSAPHGQFPEEQGAENEQTTVNKEFKRVPYNKMRLSKVENVTPLYSQDKPTEESQLKPGQEYVKVSITDELLKEHALDPYYVLACNETCPIAPVSTVSTFNDSDFVDTTQTIYMKKNICESKRPKPLSKDLMACEKMPAETQALHELDVKLEPEIIPEIGYTAMPEVKSVDTTDVSLPKLNEQVSLSELLKRVRHRNRLECMSDLKTLGVSVDPTVGKCNRKAPRCPPTAPRSPPLNPVPPPSFGLPMLKRRPPVCKAPKKKPGCKCTTCDMDMSCGVRMGEIGPGMAYELNEAEICGLKSKADLTEEVVDRLNNLSKIMSGILHKVRSNTETFFARDYEPWTPIPSWPIPQKSEEKKKWEPGKQCNYRCPLYPKARASMNPEPPCDLKPCRGFPKKRSFSMLDCFAVSL